MPKSISRHISMKLNNVISTKATKKRLFNNIRHPVICIDNWPIKQTRGQGTQLEVYLKVKYSELSNKHAANLILSEKIFLPTCLIRTYTFIYFQGKFLPTRLLEYLCLLILAEIPSYKIILSSFKLLFCSLSKRKKEPKFKMNTQFNSNVIWLQLEYKISTLITVQVGIFPENK